jgi:hypothetical protein
VTDQLLARQTQLHALEARFALRITSVLTDRGVDHDIGQRLRVAREQAVGLARQSRAASAAPALQVLGAGRGSAVLGSTPWWTRLASGIPLLVLALGLLMIDRLDNLEQIQAAAEIDAVLLADELPIGAYSDPGFGEFLRQPTP